ncbi:putative porin [Fulvivirgaceae bacterium BMA10]|uniref:Porin n=1 Tax=Splendidivirga corallicola TaxID=3051826 RepID=A0ABT8KIM9_9BACT|nr:putative porin [Fulvivirgaceae bacterium BMA10]
MKKIVLPIFLFFTGYVYSQAQNNSTENKLKFSGDFRFRVEHDWDSKKGDGTYREDRSRLRYRFRFGAHYAHNDWASFGAQIRTGNLNDQQGPHVTLGGKSGEFSTVALGFEKIYFEAQHKSFKGWIGKNTFPFFKQDELFWNDNVYPEGVAISFTHPINTIFFNSLNINTAHFIISSNNATFGQDSYFQGLQMVNKHWDNKIIFFPGFYYFNALANIPDGKGSFNIRYAILHLGSTFTLSSQPKIVAGIDFYNNVDDLGSNDSIPVHLNDQRKGYVLNVKVGELKEKGDWALHLYYAHIEKYAIVDYFAQNDWGRWDYSGQGASGSRLSNSNGFEFRIGYALGEKFNLILRAYTLRQLVAEQTFKETGKRIRLDLNIGF